MNPPTHDEDGVPIVLDDCPSPNHNTLAAIRRSGREGRCRCPLGSEIRVEYLANRRAARVHVETRSINRNLPLPAVKDARATDWAIRGAAAQKLLAPTTGHTPHLCVSEGHDPELWFSYSEASQAEARSVCVRCPMRATCEQAAITNGWVGIWGASDDADRWALRIEAVG